MAWAEELQKEGVLSDATFWGFHAKNPATQALFTKHGRLAFAFPEMGDLSVYGPDREKFKARLIAVLPTAKPGAVAVYAGQLYRFANELAVGDYVAYRAKDENRIYIARVTGPYEYDSSANSDHRSWRAIKVERDVPVTAVSQGALYELGAAMTFFQLRNYAEEWAVLLAGGGEDTATDTDETVASVSDATIQNTRDYILKTLAKELKGHPFALFVAHLLRVLGYRTRLGPVGNDGGTDIMAHKDELGFEPPIVRVQVKSGAGSVSGPTVSELIGNLGPGEFGLLVTLGTYTVQAQSKAKSNIRLIDGDELVDLILEHYDEFDSRYKSLIPLKRMYVPQPAAEP